MQRETAAPASTARRLAALAFLPGTALLLGLDSQQWETAAGWDGQLLVNIAVPLWFLALLRLADRSLRTLMLLMVPLSLVAEWIASPLLGMYTYRHAGVPFYIPFGHAVVYGSCAMIAGLPVISRHEAAISRRLAAVFAAAAVGVVVLLNDELTLVLGGAAALALRLRGCRCFYMIMALMVLAVELLGTRFGCWTWAPVSLGFLETVNPPLGAAGIYLMGDMVVQQTAAALARRHWWPAAWIVLRPGVK
jgi:hypothetical protein